MSVDFRAELEDIASLVEPEACAISPAAIDIVEASLISIDERYGPDSENPKVFHNAEHSLGVARRTIRLMNILYPHIQPRWDEGIFDVGFVVGGTHDDEQDLGPGENERVSGIRTVARIEEHGDPSLNNARFKRRVVDATQATEVVRKDDGEIVQVNVQSGSHDPAKFDVAFADINGIAMEGSFRMVNDAIRLCYEINGDPNLDELYQFLCTQESFLRKRLNDGRVKSDIAYYFPSKIEEVYDGMREAYHSNIVTAHEIAKSFRGSDEFKAYLGKAIKGVDLMGRKLIGEDIAKTLQRRILL